MIRVEIWSDVACPFCWLGKRRFEQALADFAERDRVRIEWRSFQLDPGLRTDPTVRIDEHLARAKGVPAEVARGWNDRLARDGRAVGLDYRFDRIVVANTFDAHRLLQIAKARGRGDDAEERLFSAYFSEGRNVADRATLAELGAEIGLDAEEVGQALAGGGFVDEVLADLEEARALGVDGVPFFVLDRRFAVVGAQAPETFLGALERAAQSPDADPAT